MIFFTSTSVRPQRMSNLGRLSFSFLSSIWAPLRQNRSALKICVTTLIDEKYKYPSLWMLLDDSVTGYTEERQRVDSYHPARQLSLLGYHLHNINNVIIVFGKESRFHGLFVRL